jgi:hypothetical protein
MASVVGTAERRSGCVSPGGAIPGDAATSPDAGLRAHLEATVDVLTLLTPRIEASGIWREGGHRSAAAMLASLEGLSPGQAKNTLTNGRRLDQLPGTEYAVRKGSLTAPKLRQGARGPLDALDTVIDEQPTV